MGNTIISLITITPTIFQRETSFSKVAFLPIHFRIPNRPSCILMTDIIQL